MQIRPRAITTSLAILAAGATLVGCLGRESSVTLDAKTAAFLGIVAVQLEVGDGEIVDFCVVLNDSICGFPGGEAVGCGLDLPTDNVRVFCADPILAQWPSTWTVTEATWTAPSVPASGSILIEPAFNFATPPGTQVITDPGFSAHVLRLDASTDFGPADVEISLAFDHANAVQGCVKGVEVMIAELQSFPIKVLIPLGNPVIDFPNMTSPDGVICLDALRREAAPLVETPVLRPPRPNPSRRAVSLAIALPSEAAVDLTILDVQGREVRTLAARRYGPGNHELVWDGTDAAGRSVASGTYYARLTVEGALAGVERIVILGD